MIVLVVNMHACVTYSHVGDWYMTSAIEPSMAAKVPFIVWQSMLQSFFMGLLLFLAGYFAAGSLALIGGPLALLALLAVGMQYAPKEAFFGGWHWPAFGLAVWEQLTGLGLALGALALFSRQLNADTAEWRWLGDRSFAVYVLHAPVLVALAMLFRKLPYHLYGLVALLTLVGLVISYVLADLARRLPGLRAIL